VGFESVKPMAGLKVELPTIQNWSCHSCSGCCRQHAIEVTDEERQRILDQRWEEDEAVGPDQPTVVAAGPIWNRSQRLAHRADGACVFLADDGLCRIHAKFGEEAKPLACRIYPYAFHPTGKGVTVSLRFSCPSVVGNRGKQLAKQATDIRTIARAVVPDNVTDWPAPEISPGQRPDWPDFRRFVEALDTTLSGSDASITVRLLRALFWINLVSEARFDAVKGSRLTDFLSLIREAAAGELTDETIETKEPTGLAKTQFRLLTGQYGRRDTVVDLETGWRGHWQRLRYGVRFARGRGLTPRVQDCFTEVPFESLEQPFGGLPDGAEELLTRYFRVKIQGLAFCGPAYYGVPLVEGFRSLVLIYPSVLWLARWLAAGDERKTLTLNDVERAIAIADHHHGYSPAFGLRGFRSRVRLLARMDEIGRLCAWYAR
jgi:lysine-N-methylase